jgi:hypothetical protein
MTKTPSMNPLPTLQEIQHPRQQAPQVEECRSEEDHLDPHPQDQDPQWRAHTKAEKSNQWDNCQQSSLEIGPCPRSSSTN